MRCLTGTGRKNIPYRTAPALKEHALRGARLGIDYLGHQYVVELKIWHGDEYNKRGEKQLADYLNYYHLKQGYLLSFNFNKKKQTGIKEIYVEGKKIIEVVV